MHTWLGGPLKYRDAPLPFVSSLRDFDGELIHAVCHQGVDQYSPLGAFLVLPARWLAFFSEPNCVRSGLRENNIFHTQKAHCSPFLAMYFLVHLRCFIQILQVYLQRFPPCFAGGGLPHFNYRVNPGDEHRLRRHDPDADVLGYIFWWLWDNKCTHNSTNTERKKCLVQNKYLNLTLNYKIWLQDDF